MSAPTTIPTLRIRPRHGWAALNLLEVWAYRDVLWMLALRGAAPILGNCMAPKL